MRERPMLWKELFIERVASLGRFGRWLGVSAHVGIGGGSLVLAAMIVYSAIYSIRIPTWSSLGIRHDRFRSSSAVLRERFSAGCSSGASACERQSRSPRNASAARWTPS